MESPVVVDKPPEYLGHPRDNERGFPFDEEESGAWSELAARHPDIAARLRQRPASATWARKRRPASQDATEDFGENFGGFDRFPFDDIPPEFREHFPSHWNRRFGSREEAPPPPQQAQEPPHSPQQQTTSTQTEQPPGPSTEPEQTHLPQYGLRNTVDLGQKSPADPSLVDVNERGQRSMSAPPEGSSANQTNTPNMNPQNHQEPHPEQPQQPSNVRHIPIFVEGRDKPVINKSVDHGTHFGETKQTYVPPPPQPHPHPQPPPDQYFPDDGPTFHPPPNFSRAFGTPFNKGFRQGPQPFGQQKAYPQAFARGASPQRSQSPKPQTHPEEFVKVPVHHEHTAPKADTPRPPQKQQQQQQQQQQAPPQQPQPQARQQTPPPQAKPAANDPITLILSVQTDVLNLMTDVENFTGSKKDKRYLYLDEMLTRNLIKLDNIETDGKENIRQARKEAIRCIQKCIAVLEAKAEKGSAPQPQDAEMTEASAETEKAPENGVEAQVKEPADGEGAAPMEESTPSQEVTDKPQGSANDNATPQAVDTRPPEEASTEEQKDKEIKASPKKVKNVKKRDKSKDKKDKSVSNKEQAVEEVSQGPQAMEVDGAASQ